MAELNEIDLSLIPEAKRLTFSAAALSGNDQAAEAAQNLQVHLRIRPLTKKEEQTDPRYTLNALDDTTVQVWAPEVRWRS